jgi:hypothetical protein
MPVAGKSGDREGGGQEDGGRGNGRPDDRELPVTLCRLVRISGLAAAVLTSAPMMALPARADFFDGARRTFQTDIPHFFQDDIPCAFGGQPTSHTRTSCKKSEGARGAAVKAGDHAGVPPPPKLLDAPNPPAGSRDRQP